MSEKRVERQYRLKTEVLVAKIRERGFTHATLADKLDVNVSTVRRWLNGAKAYMRSILPLARALKVPHQELMLEEGEDERLTYVDAEITIDRKLPVDIDSIVRQAQEAIGSEYRILVMYVGPGSIKISVKIHAEDAIRLLDTFLSGGLEHLNVISVDFTSSLSESSVRMPPGNYKLHDPVTPTPPAPTHEINLEDRQAARASENPDSWDKPQGPDDEDKPRGFHPDSSDL